MSQRTICQAIEFHNRTRNIISLQHNDGTSVSVGGKGKIFIPVNQAGHQSIIHAVSNRDLIKGRLLWIDEDGQEVSQPEVPTPEGDLESDSEI